MTFDPAKWAQSVWLHPTRDQLERGYAETRPHLQNKRKLQLRMASSGFGPTQAYHATVVIQGVNRHMVGETIMTATRVLADSPTGFDGALSYMFHVQYGGRPLIGLIASEEPLDRDSAVAHFVARGDEGQ